MPRTDARARRAPGQDDVMHAIADVDAAVLAHVLDERKDVRSWRDAQSSIRRWISRCGRFWLIAAVIESMNSALATNRGRADAIAPHRASVSVTAPHWAS